MTRGRGNQGAQYYANDFGTITGVGFVGRNTRKQDKSSTQAAGSSAKGGMIEADRDDDKSSTQAAGRGAKSGSRGSSTLDTVIENSESDETSGEDLDKSIADLKQELVNIQAEKKKWKEKINTIEAELAQFDAYKVNSQQEHEKNKKTKDLQSTIIKEFQGKIRKLEDEKSAVESEINKKLKSEADDANVEIQNSGSIIKNQKERNQELKHSKEKIEKENRDLNVNNDLLVKNLKRANDQIQELDRIKKELSGLHVNYEDKKQCLEEKNEQTIQDLKQTKKCLESLQKSLVEKNTSLASENNFLKKVDKAKLKKANDAGYQRGMQNQVLKNGVDQIESRMKYNHDDHIVRSMKEMVEKMQAFHSTEKSATSKEILQFLATAEQLKILFEMHAEMEQYSESSAARLLHEMVDEVLLPFFLCWRRFYATDTMGIDVANFVDDACEKMMKEIMKSKKDMLCKQVISLGLGVEAYVISATSDKDKEVHNYTVTRDSVPEYRELEEWMHLAAKHVLRKNSLQDAFEASVGKIVHLSDGRFELQVEVVKKIVHCETLSETGSYTDSFRTAFSTRSDLVPYVSRANSFSTDVLASGGSREVSGDAAQRCNECIDFLEYAYARLDNALKDMHFGKEVKPFNELFTLRSEETLTNAWFDALELFQMVCGYLLKQATVLSVIDKKHPFRLFSLQLARALNQKWQVFPINAEGVSINRTDNVIVEQVCVMLRKLASFPVIM